MSHPPDTAFPAAWARPASKWGNMRSARLSAGLLNQDIQMAHIGIERVQGLVSGKEQRTAVVLRHGNHAVGSHCEYLAGSIGLRIRRCIGVIGGTAAQFPNQGTLRCPRAE